MHWPVWCLQERTRSGKTLRLSLKRLWALMIPLLTGSRDKPWQTNLTAMAAGGQCAGWVSLVPQGQRGTLTPTPWGSHLKCLNKFSTFWWSITSSINWYRYAIALHFCRSSENDALYSDDLWWDLYSHSPPEPQHPINCHRLCLSHRFTLVKQSGQVSQANKIP